MTSYDTLLRLYMYRNTDTDSLSDTIHFKVNNADTDKTLFTSRIVYGYGEKNEK